MRYNPDVIVAGSEVFHVPEYSRSCNLPVYPEIIVSRALAEIALEEMRVDPGYCEIRRGREMQVCHVCEGGHHVHLVWH